MTGALRHGDGETTGCDGFDRIALGEGGWMERVNECEDRPEIERELRSGCVVAFRGTGSDGGHSVMISDSGRISGDFRY